MPITTTHIAPATSSTNAWLRCDHIVTCDRNKLQVYTLDGQRALDTTLSQTVPANATGRAANIVHGCDILGSTLALGTSSGLVLIMDMEASTTTKELAGHTKVVAFMRLAPKQHLFTSSLDKSVRLWELAGGSCLHIVKVGTPVLQLALLPPSDDNTKVLMGCGDGTVRLWDPACKKTSRALTTLRFAHKDYVGEIRLTDDASRLLSCSRDGHIQTWRADGKHGFVPAADLLPGRETGDDGWRVDLTSHGLVSITRRGGVHLWRPAANEPLRLLEESFGVPMAESPCDSAAAAELPGGDDTTTLRVAFIGVRATPGGSGGMAVELHVARLTIPAASTEGASDAQAGGSDVGEGHSASAATAGEGGGGATAGGGGSHGLGGSSGGTPSSVPTGWTRWCALAAEEGVTMDAALQQRLVMMEHVAANTGRELAEATVRAFLRRSMVKEIT